MAAMHRGAAWVPSAAPSRLHMGAAPPAALPALLLPSWGPPAGGPPRRPSSLGPVILSIPAGLLVRILHPAILNAPFLGYQISCDAY